MRIELAVVRRRQRAGHRQDERHPVDDSTGAVEGVSVDGFSARRGRGLEGNGFVEHYQVWAPAAQLIAMCDEHSGVCDQYRVDIGGDDVVPVSQYERSAILVGEFLFKLSQRGFRTGVEARHLVASFVLDQEARCQSNQELSSPCFGGIERALKLDGENSLLDLVRQESAVSRKHSSRQEILAIHP